MRKDFLKNAAARLTSEELSRFLETRKASTSSSAKVENLDLEKRTMTISVSSEVAVKRWYGREILDHSEKSVDLRRFQDGAAVLWNHSSSRQIGVVERAWIQDKKIMTDIRFSRSSFGEEIMQDVADEIVRNVSVRYSIDKIKLVEESKGVDTWRVLKWEPVEVSFEPVPADPTVGVGRSAGGLDDEGLEEAVLKLLENKQQRDADNQPQQEQTVGDENEENNSEETQGSPLGVVDKFRNYLTDMSAVADAFQARHLMAAAVGRKVSPHEFAQEIAEREESTPAGTPAPQATDPLNLTNNEKRQFSFRKVIVAQLHNNWDGAGFEREVCMAAADERGLEVEGGVVVPIESLREDEVFNDSGNSEALVFKSHRPKDFITLLRNKMKLEALGARTMYGLRGEVAIPRHSGGMTAQWVDENERSKSQKYNTDQITLKPRTLTSHAGFNVKLLAQNTMDVENLIRDDLANGMALAMDFAALMGQGGKQPRGVVKMAGVQETLEGKLDYDKVVELESKIAAANADVGTLAYLTNPLVRGLLKTTRKDPGSGQFVWEKNNTMNGYRSEVTNQVPVVDGKTHLFYANWSDVIMGFFSGLRIVTDPYTLADSRRVRIIFSKEADVAIRHPESFAYYKGIPVSSSPVVIPPPDEPDDEEEEEDDEDEPT